MFTREPCTLVRCGGLRRFSRQVTRLLPAVLILVGCVSWAQAQTPPTTNAAATRPESPAVARLQGVPGVKAGMSSDQLIDHALELSKASQWQDAEKILTEVIGQEPQNLRAYQVAAQVFELRAAAVRADASESDAARKSDVLVDQAVKTYLDYVAKIAMETNDLQTAEQAYKAVLQHERHRYNPQALLGMARVMAARNSVQAIDRYKTYINPRLCPAGAKDAQAHLELGRIYLDRGLLNQAVSTLETARELDPESPEVLLALARAYLATARFQSKAIEVAREAVRKAPANPAYRNVYAQILLTPIIAVVKAGGSLTTEARNRFDEARRESTEAVRLAKAEVQAAPDDPQRLGNLMNCYAIRQQILDIAARLDSADTSALVESARCREDTVAVQHTLALHRILSELLTAPTSARNNPAYLEAVADLQARVYKLKDAAETCRALLKIDPANATAKRILEQVPKEQASPPAATSTAPAAR
jgi:predicted Zn-dependent protease